MIPNTNNSIYLVLHHALDDAVTTVTVGPVLAWEIREGTAVPWAFFEAYGLISEDALSSDNPPDKIQVTSNPPIPGLYVGDTWIKAG